MAQTTTTTTTTADYQGEFSVHDASSWQENVSGYPLDCQVSVWDNGEYLSPSIHLAVRQESGVHQHVSNKDRQLHSSFAIKGDDLHRLYQMLQSIYNPEMLVEPAPKVSLWRRLTQKLGRQSRKGGE